MLRLGSPLRARATTLFPSTRSASRQRCSEFHSTPSTRFLGGKPRPLSGHEMNPLEDGANDLGGPGGQELYPASMALQKRYASITAAGVFVSCAVMYLAKRKQWSADPNVVNVLVHDNSKGELDDVKFVPVRVRS